ncbi:hypothetical protein [Nonomuraea jabiensis]|uniref:hypothetical protein n=1 Tax=Nonomuraea jabiensis TaxID=882448 RepID=UPI003D758A47
MAVTAAGRAGAVSLAAGHRRAVAVHENGKDSLPPFEIDDPRQRYNRMAERTPAGSPPGRESRPGDAGAGFASFTAISRLRSGVAGLTIQ